jgi:hypothetical protein
MSSPVQESGLRNTSPSPEPGTTQNNETGALATDSDSDNDKADPGVAETKTRPTFAIKMLNLCKEIIVMVLIAVAYAALTNESPPKVSKSPAAYPFFPTNSIITDWYKGQITEAIEKARSSDIAFVMFYAPWDAESQTARKQLEVTASYMHQEVAFAAVNCWQPGSECKRQYSKVYKWPVLIAYPTHGRGIQYNGPLEAFHMIKFLQNLCKPLVRPNNTDDLIGKHDTVISANINVLPGSYEYAVFYSTALRFLERDPFRDAIFAVLPQKQDLEPSIHLHVWNGTITYDGEWSPESLTAWILKNSQQVTSWVAPTGMKSLTLASFVQPGPTLILFTPKNPLFQRVDYYDMLKEVTYEYYNCANNTHAAKRRELVREERLRGRENYQKLRQRCLNRRINEGKRVVTSVPNIWTNSTFKDICNCVSNEMISKICPEKDASVLTVDPMSPDHLLKTVAEEACREFLLAHRYAPPIFERRVENSLDVTGFACQTNSSLGFVAIDSLRFSHFAEKLGVDLSTSVQKTGVVIVDEKMETHHIMAANLNGTNLRLFIRNFTQNTLSRSLRSRVHLKTKSNHFYPHLDCSRSSHFCVTELATHNFLDTILQPNKVVVVFYYSKQCSFCNGIGYVFLTAAKLLFGVENMVFARIDGDANLLPWEYTMESYPTILFIPANRKSESRAFPKNLQITVPNLIGFILANVEPVLKLKTMWSICCQTKFADEKSKCVASVRMETLTVIDKTLKEWRNSTRKQNVLHKLQVLRHLHLLFAHSPEEVVKIRSYLTKVRD